MEITIKSNILTKNDCYKSGRTITPNSMQLHTIGTAQNTAASLASYWNQGGVQACVHYCIDSEQEGLVLQFLPDNRRSWADGGYGNGNSITVELMESDYMKYTSGANYSVTNETKFKADVTRAYNTAVQFFAIKCKEYGWNPQEKMSNGLHRVYSHDEGRRLGLSTAHVDPTHIWNRYGWTMDKFRADVVKAMNGVIPTPVTNTETHLYRVRKSWADSKSQLGAYEILQNAKANCPAGYSVYDERGNLVWTSVDAVSSAAVQGAQGVPQSKEDYIAKVGSICQSLMAQTGILASVVASQCCIETGFGLGADSTELVKRNNLLGMKTDLINNTWKEYTVWNGQSFTKRTPEYYNGKLTYINDSFRVYKDYEQCIKDYEMFLLHVQNNKGYKYASVAGMTDPAKVIHKIRIGTGTDAKPEGYCTDPAYETKILSLIKEYNLDRFNVTKKKEEVKTVKYCYITKKSSPIRTGAAAAKKQCDFSPLIKGTKLEIVKTVKNSVGNTWYQVKWNGKTGYVYSGNVSLTPVDGEPTIAKRAVANARAIAQDNSHGYNNTSGYRGGPDFACSSFVAECYTRAGVKLGTTPDKVYTKDMKKIFTSHGFTDVTSKVNIKTCKGMLEGDVLINPGVHTEIYTGNKMMIGARGNPNSGKAEGGKVGDQTGNEITESKYVNNPWKIVLRYKEKAADNATPSKQTQYRVQTGIYGLKDNAINMKSKMAQNGFDCLIVTSNGQYITQAGLFLARMNADALAKKIKAAGLPVAVVEVV